MKNLFLKEKKVVKILVKIKIFLRLKILSHKILNMVQFLNGVKLAKYINKLMRL